MVQRESGFGYPAYKAVHSDEDQRSADGLHFYKYRSFTSWRLLSSEAPRMKGPVLIEVEPICRPLTLIGVDSLVSRVAKA